MADRVADMDVLQGNVKEEKGMTIYKYRYQVDSTVSLNSTKVSAAEKTPGCKQCS